MCLQVRDFMRQDCISKLPRRNFGDVPQNAPATSGAIRNASMSSSSVASMKDVHPVCAPAASWTRRRNVSQSRSLSRFLQPLGLTTGQGVGPADYPLLGLYQRRGNNGL